MREARGIRESNNWREFKAVVAYIISTIAGLWLMASPDLLDYSNPAKTNLQIVGPLVATFAIMALWEILRAVRWANTVLGAWLIVSPLVLGHISEGGLNSFVTGVLLVAMSLVKGPRRHPFGGGWSSLWKDETTTPAAQ